MKTTGKVTGIVSNLVTVEVNGPVSQNELCYITVGDTKLMAEVIKVNGKSAAVQVFESTRGLKNGNEVEFENKMLEATLGPGLLSSSYDGLQNDLTTMTGVFLKRGVEQEGGLLTERLGKKGAERLPVDQRLCQQTVDRRGKGKDGDGGAADREHQTQSLARRTASQTVEQADQRQNAGDRQKEDGDWVHTLLLTCCFCKRYLSISLFSCKGCENFATNILVYGVIVAVDGGILIVEVSRQQHAGDECLPRRLTAQTAIPLQQIVELQTAHQGKIAKREQRLTVVSRIDEADITRRPTVTYVASRLVGPGGVVPAKEAVEAHLGG